MFGSKKEFPMNDKQQNFAFEVAQEIGVSGKDQRIPGLAAPTTGADELQSDVSLKGNSTSHAERYFPKV